MATFVEFRDADTKTTLWINPDHVRAIRPSPDDPGISTLYYDSGGEDGVDGNHEEIARRLNSINSGAEFAAAGATIGRP